jgi:MFS family permease
LKGNESIENEKIDEIEIKEIFNILLNKERIRFFYGLILMASQAFFYNGIFYTYTLVLQTFYHISKEAVGLFLIPLSVASFLGPLVLGKYFDSWSRRRMIALTFALSGILLIITAVNFITNYLSFVFQQFLWFITFFVASPAASSAHLTISEIFPIEMRSQAMAIFFSIGLGIGGVISPFLYGNFVQTDNKSTIFFSYILAGIIMIFTSIFGYLYGVDSENKSLEQISKNINDRKSEEN